MCGIWGLFGLDSHDVNHFTSMMSIACRGPDCFHMQNIKNLQNCTLGFHRLAVVDSIRGMQPMRLIQYPHLYLLCNGEIYNFQKLRERFAFEFETACDCEIILHLYNKFGIEETVTLLDGVFALMLVDMKERRLMLARDTYGVRPMFYFTTASGTLGLCSEAKGLVRVVEEVKDQKNEEIIQHFPPAHYKIFDIRQDGKVELKRSHKFHSFEQRPFHWKLQNIELSEGEEEFKSNIRHLLVNAVDKRLMSSRRVGSLLSGGLDSSLIAAITAKKLKERGCQLPLQTFSIGLGESPDVLAARKVAEHIGSEHHEVSFTPDEGIQAISDVIYALESYDVTTVRASIPMYLLSKYVSEKTNTVVIMSGEGADELAQGYIYFHKQPSPQEGDEESRRLLSDLYLFDVMRTDRSTAAHGLEVRAPFLDHAFTSYFLSLPATLRMPQDGVEKYLLRSAFTNTDLIPTDILWRPKEAFSDGVSSKKKSWFSILQDYISTQVTDDDLMNVSHRYPNHTPKTKEALYYRQVFESKLSGSFSKLIPYQWLPRWTECGNDPSARCLAHYKNDEKEKD